MPIAGQSLAERPGGHVDARRHVHVGVALEDAAQGIEAVERGNGEVAAQRQRRIVAWCRMSLREDEAVTIDPLVGGVAVAHHPEEQGRQDVGLRERAAGVAHAGMMRGLKDEAADGPRLRLELRHSEQCC